jgi:hypothetical protein
VHGQHLGERGWVGPHPVHQRCGTASAFGSAIHGGGAEGRAQRYRSQKPLFLTQCGLVFDRNFLKSRLSISFSRWSGSRAEASKVE